VLEAFSPRYEVHDTNLVSLDVSGLERLLGTPRAIGGEIVRTGSVGGGRVHVAMAATQTAALILAQARPGLTVIEPGCEALALARLPIGVLKAGMDVGRRAVSGSVQSAVSVFKTWGVRTLGELAALPPADLTARFGRQAAAWQALARGEDVRPFVPTLPEERFESLLELEWPIEGLEPLSFVLTRLLEPLSIRLERRDRGVAVLHVVLRLVTKDVHTRRLQVPTPMRDVRALRTLALLDLEAHPPSAAIDCVTVIIDPTPGRVLQHTLFTRPYPTPEALSTLLARLGALMGQDRIGSAAVVDTYRPGAFAMHRFKTEHREVISRETESRGSGSRERDVRPAHGSGPLQEREQKREREGAKDARPRVVSALHRCRRPVPARVVVERGRPVRVTTDRRGFDGGIVLSAAGPWRTSGDWWAPGAWNHDEWDVALGDGGVYRIFQDRLTDGWCIDAIVD
jgi:protein ImuB